MHYDTIIHKQDYMKSNNKCDVIVTYCWNRVGYNILRSLSAQNIAVWSADTSKHNICSMSKYCKGSFTYPDPFLQEDEFINCLVEKVNYLKPKVLLPTHDEGIVIARNKHRFPKDLIIPIEDAEKLQKLSNKRIATILAKEAGIPVPYIYNSIDEIKSFPIVFKTVIGNSAKGVFFPKDKESILKLASQFSDVECLMEEWIGGGDVCVDCVRWDNFFKASVYRAIVTKTDGGGTTTQREIIEMPQLIDYAKKFLDYVDYNGVCGLDFRVDNNTGKIGFIETNVRFTGGLATPIAAGFDIPHILYCLATEGKYSKPISIKIGTKTKWILGDIITLVGRLIKLKFNAKELSQVATFSRFDAFDDYRSDDKKAIIGEMRYYFSKLIKSGKLNP